LCPCHLVCFFAFCSSWHSPMPPMLKLVFFLLVVPFFLHSTAMFGTVYQRMPVFDSHHQFTAHADGLRVLGEKLSWWS
jgi:hypothetical protein